MSERDKEVLKIYKEMSEIVKKIKAIEDELAERHEDAWLIFSRAINFYFFNRYSIVYELAQKVVNEKELKGASNE